MSKLDDLNFNNSIYNKESFKNISNINDYDSIRLSSVRYTRKDGEDLVFVNKYSSGVANIILSNKAPFIDSPTVLDIISRSQITLVKEIQSELDRLGYNIKISY